MKTYLLLFILSPLLCFAQQNKTQPVENKSSSTECPSWKKKDVRSNKADYFQYLKTSKSQKSVTASNESKEKPVSSRQIAKNEEPEVKEKSSVSKTDENRTESISTVKKNKTPVDTKTRQVLVNEDKSDVEMVSEKAKPEEKKTIATTAKAIEQNDDLEKSDKTEAEKNEKLEDEKPKAKQKLTRLTRKTTKVRKHSNSKCPSF